MQNGLMITVPEASTTCLSTLIKKESPTERMRRWRLANPDRYKATKRAIYLRNRDKVISRAKKWAADNPERAKANADYRLTFQAEEV